MRSARKFGVIWLCFWSPAKAGEASSRDLTQSSVPAELKMHLSGFLPDYFAMGAGMGRRSGFQGCDPKVWLFISTEHDICIHLGLFRVKRLQSSCLWETHDLCLG